MAPLLWHRCRRGPIPNEIAQQTAIGADMWLTDPALIETVQAERLADAERWRQARSLSRNHGLGRRLLLRCNLRTMWGQSLGHRRDGTLLVGEPQAGQKLRRELRLNVGHDQFDPAVVGVGSDEAE